MKTLLVILAAVTAACQPPPPLRDDVDVGGGDDAGVPLTDDEQALAIVNGFRAASGLPAVVIDDAIERAAQSHIDYLVTNGASTSDLSAHEEAPGLAGFTGVTFADRERAAGYGGEPFFEVIHGYGDPVLAVPGWLNTVFHRNPLLHPRTVALGYARTSADAAPNEPHIDVMDFGGAEPADIHAVFVYPPPDSVDAAPSFDGLEAPPPPTPPSGHFPSGPLITILFDTSVGARIDTHEIFAEDGRSLPHTIVSPDDPDVGQFMANSVCLYTSEPASPGERFRVVVTGHAGLSDVALDWSFRAGQ